MMRNIIASTIDGITNALDAINLPGKVSGDGMGSLV
jgi:hypothetical protein